MKLRKPGARRSIRVATAPIEPTGHAGTAPSPCPDEERARQEADALLEAQIARFEAAAEAAAEALADALLEARAEAAADALVQAMEDSEAERWS